MFPKQTEMPSFISFRVEGRRWLGGGWAVHSTSASEDADPTLPQARRVRGVSGWVGLDLTAGVLGSDPPMGTWLEIAPGPLHLCCS